MTVLIRPLSLAEMSIPVEWAAAEGWNPGLYDAAPFHAADPNGFLAAFIDGVPAACISVVRSGADFGFLGFYICRPDLRGRGIGWQVWQAGMTHLRGRTIGLDGVIAQQDNYRKSGFVLAHRNIRFSGPSRITTAADPQVRVIDATLTAAVIAYDRPCYSADRTAFLNRWLEPPAGAALAFVADDVVKGYGVIRPARDGHKIGPLFADDATIAERLFVALAATAPDQTIVLDAPETNPEAMALARRHGLAPAFETARMYAGSAPVLPMARIFGITSFELG